MARDSVLGTFVVAAVLCLVCSLVVSAAAVGWRARQEENKKLDVQKNVLVAAGLIDATADEETIAKTYANLIKPVAVELGTANVADVPEDYSAADARTMEKLSSPIETDGPKPGVPRRENVAYVYQVVKDGNVESYVIPIYGKGLWSTLYGFIALANDGDTVVGISYYQHGETPGLGGEVESDKFKNDWKGKEIYADGEPAIKLIKGAVGPSTPDAEHKVDGLSGATITSVGVQNMVNYWLGDDAFGPYLKAQTSSDSDN